MSVVSQIAYNASIDGIQLLGQLSAPEEEAIVFRL